MAADALTHEMNVNVNTKTLSQCALRHSDLKYSIDIARESKIELETAKRQHCYTK